MHNFGLEGRPEQQYSQKSAVIQQIAGLRQLSPDEILFVDDDPQEVRGAAVARHAKIWIFQNNFVKNFENLQYLRSFSLRRKYNLV